MDTIERNLAISAIQRFADDMELAGVDPDAIKQWVKDQVDNLD